MTIIKSIVKNRMRTLAVGYLFLSMNSPFRNLLNIGYDSSLAKANEDIEFHLEFVGFEVDERLDSTQEKYAEEGLQILYDGQAFRNGIPQSTFLLLKKLVSETSPAESFLQSGSLPSPPSRPPNPAGKTLALDESFVTRDGSLLATKNCFMCHAGANAGMVVAGMANTHLDQSHHYNNYKRLAQAEPLLKAISETRIFLGKDAENDRAELNNIFHQVDEFLIPTFQYARARGDNMGPFAVWTYVARMQDPATEGIALLERGETSIFTEKILAEKLPTVDPNPWWHRKYKSSSYRYAENSRFRSAHFALNFTNPHPEANDTHREHVERIDTVLKFADQTRSPEYPLPINAHLEERGAALYHGEQELSNGERLNCHSCHGSYQKQGEYGRVGHWLVDYRETGLKDVGTDSKYVEFLRRMKPLAQRTEEIRDYPGFAGEEQLIPIAEVPKTTGYVSPPLVGAWITAPYFHNGSVPTLEQVLDTRKRPRVWRRSLSPIEYDFSKVGLQYDTLNLRFSDYERSWSTIGQQESEKGRQYRAIYHTEGFGRDNRGHDFGDVMNDEERKAVIEFIKSLSGPNMTPADEEMKKYTHSDIRNRYKHMTSD